MQFFSLFLLIFLSITNAESHVLNPHDPTPSDNDAALWDALYYKLNSLLSEADTLKKILLEMKERQRTQGDLITQLQENCHSRSEHQQEYPREQLQQRHEPEYYQPSPEQQHHSEPNPLELSESTPDHQWITIMRRIDGSVDFQRSWNDYKYGFGNPDGEFFMGLEKIYETTTRAPHELLIVLEDWDNARRYAKYDRFRIGSEQEDYAMVELGAYSGDAGDSLAYHRGMRFSTVDRSNAGLCPQNYGGGWWFNQCEDSNLHSVYRQRYDVSGMRKIVWSTWKGWNYSLKFAEMKIRPKL